MGEISVMPLNNNCSDSILKGKECSMFNCQAAGVQEKQIISNSKVHQISVSYNSCCMNDHNCTCPDFSMDAQAFSQQFLSSPVPTQRRIALFVEPSPFSYVSGYKSRFQNFIKHLRENGDEVIVVTNDKEVPNEFCGAKVIGSWSFPFPWYSNVPLSLALSPRIIREVADFKPDVIHATSPGIMVFGALAIAKLLAVPIVMSYHTHVPLYIPKYTFHWLVKPMWLVIKFLHGSADLTLVPSAALAKELENEKVVEGNKIRVWQKGVDSENFHPRFRSDDMRSQLTDREPHKPLIIHVGRLAVEKNLAFFKPLMDRLPGVRLAFVGDGPYRGELEEMFKGFPVVFTGMLHGEELSKAYASGDIFITPSESETLGLVLLEAMSSGLPVIAARAGGFPDIVTPEGEGKIGFLFKPGNVDDCLAKVKMILGSAEFQSEIGQAARVEVEKHDWKAATKRIRNEHYNAAIWFSWKKRYQLLQRVFWWLGYPFRRSPSIKDAS